MNYTKLTMLYRKWVSADRPVDLVELRRVILREKRCAERGVIRVSAGLLREMRGELAYVSRCINTEAR